MYLLLKKMKGDEILNLVKRAIDELGRVVLPIEIREKIHLQAGDAVIVFIQEESVCIKKVEPSCLFCNSKKSLSILRDKFLCKTCYNEVVPKWFDDSQDLQWI